MKHSVPCWAVHSQLLPVAYIDQYCFQVPLDAVFIVASLTVLSSLPSHSTLTLSSQCLWWIIVSNGHCVLATILFGFTSIWSHQKPKQFNGGIRQIPCSNILILLSITNHLFCWSEQYWPNNQMKAVHWNCNPSADCHWFHHILGNGDLRCY